jgi:hypothetical protein
LPSRRKTVQIAGGFGDRLARLLLAAGGFITFHANCIMGTINRKKDRRHAPWTVAEISRLGKRPDSVLAKRWHRTIQEVVAKREELRIRLPTPPRPWTAREIRLLGTMSDPELGRRLRRKARGVTKKRINLKIPAYRTLRFVGFWKRSEDKLLGRMSDRELALRLGRTVVAVKQRRAGMGIPIFGWVERYGQRWKPSELKHLGKLQDNELAKKLGRTLRTVKAQRALRRIAPILRRYQSWQPWELKLLGTEPDEKIARRLGRGVPGVRTQRRRLKIQKFSTVCRRYTRDEDKLLGTMTDEELAKRIGRTIEAVGTRRRAFGISPFPACGYKAPREWRAADKALMRGPFSDEEIAERLGCRLACVRSWRRRHGIKDPTTNPRWTPGQHALLGTASDAVIAKLIGRTVAAVNARRVNNKIPAWSGNNYS